MKRKLVKMLTAFLVCTFALTGCGQTKQPTNTTPDSGKDTKTNTPADSKAKPTEFKQSPMLDSISGLAPVKDRLPKVPKITNEMPDSQLKYEIGTFGGDLRTVTSAVDWDADVFVMNNEALLNTPGILGEEITGNVLESYEASSDQKVFTFKLREGLKWSDGTPVTMEDFKFTVEDVIFNKEITPIFPGWLSAGGKSSGNPMKFETVDNWTFRISFDQPYGGFPIRLAIQGWRGYTDLLKPAHYLKKFHKKYADAAELEKATKDAKYESWVQLFNEKDITNWELNKPNSIGFPKLYPWLLTKKDGNTYIYERNPYYFKVDTAGNQLPYIDKIVSNLVQDIEMVTMKTISGEVDFCRESAALVKMPLYKENEKNGIKALLTKMHVTPTDIFLNHNYPDPVFQKVVNDVRFKKALNLAMDRKEIIDTIYYGFADPGQIVDSTFDLDQANKLLDEMGMIKGSDGKRTAPDGSKFSFIMEVGAQAPDIVPLSELVVAQWQKLGLNVSMKRIEQSLIGQKIPANEVQAYMIWTHTPLYYMADWGMGAWAPTWNLWFANKGAKGEEPPAKVKDFYAKIEKLNQLPPKEALKVFDELKADMKENLWYFVHVDNVKQPLVINAKLGNVSDKGFAIAANFSAEQFFFKK